MLLSYSSNHPCTGTVTQIITLNKLKECERLANTPFPFGPAVDKNKETCVFLCPNVYIAMAMSVEELIENFSLFPDWEERYRYLIDLADTLSVFPENLKTPENKIEGCVSQVWMVPDLRADGRFDFLADSDSHIVRGLIAVLRIIYTGRTAEEIAAIDIKGIFGQLGLESHLSPNRRNGFYAMVGAIRRLAASTSERSSE